MYLIQVQNLESYVLHYIILTLPFIVFLNGETLKLFC